MLDYGCEDRYAGDGAAACGHRGGVARKAILRINGEFRAETARCLKCDHLLHDGSVRLDFMTDDVNEAEEMRILTVADTFRPGCLNWRYKVSPALRADPERQL